MKKIIRLTETDLTRIIRRVIAEQEAKQVAGPFKDNKNKLDYYVYEENGKFYIYYKTVKENEPTLKNGSAWDNSGKGYTNKQEAINVINDIIKESGNTRSDDTMMNERRFR